MISFWNYTLVIQVAKIVSYVTKVMTESMDQSCILKLVSASMCISPICVSDPSSVCTIVFLTAIYYLRQRGNLFAGFCLFVCLWVSKITRKVMDGSFWNFEGMPGMAQTTSDSILGVIRQESWIPDHFEIFVSMSLKGNCCCCYGAGTWQTTWCWIKVF